MSSTCSHPASLLAILVTLLTATDALSASSPYGCEIGSRLTDKARANSEAPRILSWKQMLESGRNGSDRQKLEQVNRFFNEFEFVTDRAQWGRRDHWATPTELMESGVGDCEDFALAKYISLRCLGISVHRLRLTYTFALKLNKAAHMVLVYYPAEQQSDPLILDNLLSDIRRASARRDLVFVYSFNDNSFWLNKQTGGSKRIGDSSYVEAWNDLRARIQAKSAAP